MTRSFLLPQLSGWLSAGFVLALAACGASSSDSASSGGYSPTGGGIEPDGGVSDSTPPPPPPEREVEGAYRSPVATGKYVWVANPKSGRVAFVDATTLAVQIAEAGNGPTYLAAVPGVEDTSIVLNVLSEDATLFSAKAGVLNSKRFKVHPKANTWAISKDGAYAVAWSDGRQFEAEGIKVDRTEGFQDLTVIDLSGKNAPMVLAVGYRPLKVGFTSASRAYAITQDGISIFDVSGTPKLVKNIATTDDPLEDPGARDVSVTPDGTYALVRRDGKAEVTVVSLEDGLRTTVILPSAVTDLDLDEEGKRAIAVMRDISEVAFLPLPRIASAPTSFTRYAIPGETVGSVSIAKGGTRAVLYTNAALVERATILDIDPPRHRVARLYAPVLGMFPTPDGLHAIVLHQPSKTPSSKAGAFSVLPIGTALPAKIVGTDAPLTAVALSPAGDRALVAERDDVTRIFGVFLVKMPSLAVTRLPLASPPIAVGIVAGAKRAFVAQEHPEGRLTFVDLDSGDARTLTGFELGARVVDGSKDGSK